MPSNRPATILLDTNVLVRYISTSDPLHTMTVEALARLVAADSKIHTCPQNMHELRQVATRPLSANGLGLSSTDTANVMNVLEAEFNFLDDTPLVYPTWRKIAETTGAAGRANYDARIVAVAFAFGIDAVLTFESAAFARYGAVANVAILDPADI